MTRDEWRGGAVRLVALLVGLAVAAVAVAALLYAVQGGPFRIRLAAGLGVVAIPLLAIGIVVGSSARAVVREGGFVARGVRHTDPAERRERELLGFGLLALGFAFGAAAAFVG